MGVAPHNILQAGEPISLSFFICWTKVFQILISSEALLLKILCKVFFSRISSFCFIKQLYYPDFFLLYSHQKNPNEFRNEKHVHHRNGVFESLYTLRKKIKKLSLGWYVSKSTNRYNLGTNASLWVTNMHLPVAQTEKHGSSNGKVIGLVPRESKKDMFGFYSTVPCFHTMYLI